MDKKKATLLLVVVFALVIFSIFQLTPQTFLPSTTTVYTPEFGHLICRGHTSTVAPQAVPKDGLTLYCGQNSYAPQGCIYTISLSDDKYLNMATVQECDNTLKNCISRGANARQTTVSIAAGKTLVVKPILLNIPLLFTTLTLNNPAITVTDQSTYYRLELQERGYLQLANDCKIGSVPTNYDIMPDDKALADTQLQLYQGTYQLRPDAIANYIIGVSPLTDARNAVTIAGINNGQPIYVVRPGEYYPIIKSTKGKLYVDTMTIVLEPKIECTPSSTYCSPDATRITTPEDKPCTGSVSGFVQVSSTQQCQFRCVNGVTTKTDCKAIPQSCPPDKPTYNPATGECETSTPIPIPQAEWTWWQTALISLAIGVILAYGIQAFANKKHGTRKPRTRGAV